MAVVPRKRKGKVVYGVLTSYGEGRTDWKLIGPNRREAEQHDRQCRREVKLGTFKPGELTGYAQVKTYAAQWLTTRKNRSAAADRAYLDRVLSFEWFAKLAMTDVRPKHFIKLVKEFRETTKLSEKTISNAMGVLSVMFRDATIEEVVASNPYIIQRGLLKRAGKKRVPYTAEEARILVNHSGDSRQGVWNAIAFYTGCRCGEVCGLRWKDWNELPGPLGSLTIERQYGGLVLKTERPRVVPVHPELARVLRPWRKVWSMHHLREPGPDDFIVPQQDGTARLRHTAYKAWRRGCTAAGVNNRSVHSTRHTFITLALRGGADRLILERITHNPKGTIMDVYNTNDWATHCKAVLCFNLDQTSPDGVASPKGCDTASHVPSGGGRTEEELDASLDADVENIGKTGSDSRTRTRLTFREAAESEKWAGDSGSKDILVSAGKVRVIDDLDARPEPGGMTFGLFRLGRAMGAL